jgi:hypothetical protein
MNDLGKGRFAYLMLRVKFPSFFFFWRFVGTRWLRKASIHHFGVSMYDRSKLHPQEHFHSIFDWFDFS